MDGGLSLCDPRHPKREIMTVRLLEENLTSNVKTKVTKKPVFRGKNNQGSNTKVERGAFAKTSLVQ